MRIIEVPSKWTARIDNVNGIGPNETITVLRFVSLGFLKRNFCLLIRATGMTSGTTIFFVEYHSLFFKARSVDVYVKERTLLFIDIEFFVGEVNVKMRYNDTDVLPMKVEAPKHKLVIQWLKHRIYRDYVVVKRNDNE